MPPSKQSSNAVEITLRDADPADFERLFEIDQACYAPQIAYSRRELRWYRTFPDAETIVAEHKVEIVGFLLFAREDTLAHIITIDVLPDFRRCGFGSALVREAEARLMRHGVRQIHLETAAGNSAAVAFWHKHGYRTRGILKSYYPGPEDAFAMLKVLPEGSANAEES